MSEKQQNIHNDNVNIYDPKQRRPSNDRVFFQKQSSKINIHTKDIFLKVFNTINLKLMKDLGHRFY